MLDGVQADQQPMQTEPKNELTKGAPVVSVLAPAGAFGSPSVASGIDFAYVFRGACAKIDEDRFREQGSWTSGFQQPQMKLLGFKWYAQA